MRRYTISNRSKNCHGDRIGYNNYYSSLSKESVINDTNIHSIVFDDEWYYQHRINIIYTIKILSRRKTTKFRNTRSRIKTGLRGLYNCGKI